MTFRFESDNTNHCALEAAHDVDGYNTNLESELQSSVHHMHAVSKPAKRFEKLRLSVLLSETQAELETVQRMPAHVENAARKPFCTYVHTENCNQINILRYIIPDYDLSIQIQS